ncbi:TetR/AcrR family transcriptional regulator [Streptomyces antibioticus]|uniref:TetR/AcrR family transcriptional regulator n=1 Tax=Streptomyces antibioticus TaxID=1890 RepID=UPI0019603732|nr:TetR/AcrR family transcriptional regulator [Streptomyces sp. S9]
MAEAADEPCTNRTSHHGRSDRLSRQRARTRTALLEAAQRLLAERHRADMSIREITEAANIGLGTFYGHFANKTDLLEAAVSMTLEQHSVRLESAVAHMDDSAEVFAVGVRLTGRLQRNHPQVARILLRVGLPRLVSSVGLAPRTRELLRASEAAGRLRVGDLDVALASAGGSLLGLMQLLDAEPHMDAEKAGDHLAANLLRMFGLPHDEAWDVATRPLPALG